MKGGEILPPNKPGKATLLPADWAPSDEDRDYAVREGLNGDDIDNEVQRLRDWAAEKGHRSRDWSARWRLWVGTSRQHRSNQRRTGGDTARDLAQEAEEIEAAMVAAGGDPTDHAAYQRFKARWKQAHGRNGGRPMSDADLALQLAREAGERARKAREPR